MTPRALLLFVLGCLDLAIGLAVEAMAYLAQILGRAPAGDDLLARARAHDGVWP